jgi:hypothetical protein
VRPAAVAEAVAEGEALAARSRAHHEATLARWSPPLVPVEVAPDDRPRPTTLEAAGEDAALRLAGILATCHPRGEGCSHNGIGYPGCTIRARVAALEEELRAARTRVSAMDAETVAGLTRERDAARKSATAMEQRVADLHAQWHASNLLVTDLRAMGVALAHALARVDR